MNAVTEAAHVPYELAPRRSGKLVNALRTYVPFVVLAVLFVVSSIVSDVFLTTDNLLNVIRASAVLGLVSLGAALVLLCGRFDLSVGSTLAAGGMGYFAAQDAGVLPAIVVGLGAGALIGSVNGFLIACLGANALIVTLGMASVISGSLLLLSDAEFIAGHQASLNSIGRGDVLGIPAPVVLFVVVLAALEWWLRRTPSGRVVAAVGANDRASHASGVRVMRVRFACFLLCGVLAALAGIVLAARLNSAQPGAGTGYEFDAITAAVLGGVSLFGGSGSMLRATVGVLILSLLSNLLNLLDVPYTSQLMVKGLLFVTIIAVDGVAREWFRR
jgi:ribose transport system permease protein